MADTKFEKQMAEIKGEQKAEELAKEAEKQSVAIEIRQYADGGLKWSFPPNLAQTAMMMSILNAVYGEMVKAKIMPVEKPKESIASKIMKPFRG
jgi:hypothetical protein